MLFIFIVLRFCTVIGLRMVKLDVPGAVMKGDPIWLNCTFDLESDELYSVKWYKNNVEFYRYLPSDVPPSQKYEQHGVYLDMARSYQGHLYLYRTDLNTEGTYRCEVSAEAPSFQTIREENDIRVYVIPETGPSIDGIQPGYKTGDEVSINCSSHPSQPPSVLYWYINNNPAPPEYEKKYRRVTNSDGLQSSILGLKFVAITNDYTDGLLKLKCVANYTIISSVTSDEYYATNSTKPLGPHLALASSRNSPIITGAKRRYEVGDLVLVNCTAPRSLSHTQLKWFVNDKEAREENTIPYYNYMSRTGQRTNQIGLRFIARASHFQKGIMRLKCSAVITTVVSKSRQEIIGGRQPSSGLQVSQHISAANNGGIILNIMVWTIPLLVGLTASTFFVA